MLRDIEKKAAAFLRRLPRNCTAKDVVSLSRQYPEEGEAYRLAGIGAEAADDEPAPPLNLSVRSGESFDELATRYSIEKNISLRDAMHAVGVARPDLAAAR